MTIEMWCLSFGWAATGPYGQRKPSDRPSHIETTTFHSLEAALKYPSCGTWWEITAPNGKVVVSSYDGLDETACTDPPLSFCARQILDARYLGSFPETKMEDGSDGWFDLVSHDDGVTWEPVLLGVKSQASKNGHPKSRNPGPLSDPISIGPCAELDRVVVRHVSGHITVRRDMLELRQNSKGTHDLFILDPESGHARGVYAAGVDVDTVIVAHSLGVRLTEKDVGSGGNSHSRMPKVWKPGLFKRAQVDGPPIDTRGHVRGALGIDRRMADIKGYGDCTYQALLWHLTHIPTGTLIVRRKERVRVEEIADALREEIPKLTDGADGVVVDEETGRRAQAVINRFTSHYSY